MDGGARLVTSIEAVETGLDSFGYIASRQIATAEGRIVGPDGKLYAHATTTCLILNHAKK